MFSRSSHAFDFEQLGAELIRALRGARSQAALSARLGYRSNVVHRWENQSAWPTACTFLKLCAARRIPLQQRFEQFFGRRSSWLEKQDPLSPDFAASFLTELRGKTPMVALAATTGINRYTLARWHHGSAEPRLPDFLRVIEASSRRLLDWIATLVDPATLPCVKRRWASIVAARQAAYGEPWSHAVLRAMELADYPKRSRLAPQWIAERIGLAPERVSECLQLLLRTGQVRKRGSGYVATAAERIDTRSDRIGAKRVKAAWTGVALERLQQGAPGYYGFSLFAIGRRDLERLQELHQQYVHAMQSVIAHSSTNECVGLYCAQLLDLDVTPANALQPAHHGAAGASAVAGGST